MAPLEVAQSIGWWLFEATKKMFYIVSPSELALNEGDHVPNYMLRYGIPMFFVMIAVEWVVMKILSPQPQGEAAKKSATPITPAYRVNDLFMSTFAGSFQQIGIMLFELCGLSLSIGAYRWVWENYRLFDIDAKENVMLCYICLMLGKDFGYYWYHRTLHEFHVMWASHSVHHSGEDYNLATGLRQGVFQPFWAPPFYCWMALLGFPPAAFAAHAQLNTLYMYWIHTDVVSRLPGPLEYIFNSPMPHRLHHRPPGNCNYAGMFIIWDRMFGTYRSEVVRKDLYGLAKQPMTFDPVKLNTNHFNRMADIGARDAPGSVRRSWVYRICARRVPFRFTFSLAALFKPIPPLKEDTRATGAVRRKWNGAQRMSWWVAVYTVIVSVFSLVGLVKLLIVGSKLHLWDGIMGTLFSGLLLSAIGRIFDQHPGQYQRAMVEAFVLLCARTAVLYAQPGASFEAWSS